MAVMVVAVDSDGGGGGVGQWYCSNEDVHERKSNK
jgi:hypothetical protein